MFRRLASPERFALAELLSSALPPSSTSLHYVVLSSAFSTVLPTPSPSQTAMSSSPSRMRSSLLTARTPQRSFMTASCFSWSRTRAWWRRVSPCTMRFARSGASQNLQSFFSRLHFQVRESCSKFRFHERCTCSGTLTLCAAKTTLSARAQGRVGIKAIESGRKGWEGCRRAVDALRCCREPSGQSQGG
jgi:hypothetical protein